MTRDEALLIARSIAAGACAMQGQSDDYCQYMRDGSYDGDPAVQSALAALTIGQVHLKARLEDIRKRAVTSVLEIAA